MFEPIKLEVDPEPKWVEQPAIQSLIANFEAIGFRKHRVYREISTKIKPMILANETRDQFGEIYQTPQGTVIGFCADTTDDMSLNVTTTELADTFAIKPNKITEGYPGASVAELYSKFKVLIADQPLKSIEDDSFDNYLQDRIHKEMQGRYDTHELPLWQEGEAVFVERWRKHHKSENDLYQTYEMLSCEAMQQIESDIEDNLGQAEVASDN